MGLKKDLETIRAASQKILNDCNAVAKLIPADNLLDVPRLIIEAEQFGYVEGDAAGYEIGYNTGEGSAEAAVLQDCNPLLEKYTTPAETVDELPAKIDEVYEAGKAAGGGGDDYYDTFWDAFQQNGNRQSYLNGFAGHGWTDETFNPKYSMTPTRAGSMFIYCHIFDLKGALERQGVTLDTSQATSVSSMFTECWTQYVPTISTVSCTACTNIFSNNTYVKSVECLVVREEGGQTFSNAFLNCTALEEIRISGKFSTNISFAQSAKLSKASIQSIYAALIMAPDASQYTLTLSLTAVNKAFETSDGANDGSTSTEWQDLTISTPWRTVLS